MMLLCGITWSFTSYTQCINNWNSCAPVEESTTITPVNAFSTVYWQSLYYPTSFTYATYYKVKMLHNGGSFLLSNVHMYFDGAEIFSNTAFQHTGGQFHITANLLGSAAPGAYEELYFEVYERNLFGIYNKGITFKFTLRINCANNLEITTNPSSPGTVVTNSSSSIGKYETNGYLKVSSAQANTGTGQLNFDAQNYVEFWPGGSPTSLPGASLTVTNGSMEAYIDGCGGLKSAVAEDRPGEVDLNKQVFEVSLAPNPTTGKAVLSFDEADNEEKHLYMHDASGRLLWEQKTSSGQIELDISDQPKGLYLLHVEKNGQKTVLKMMKE